MASLAKVPLAKPLRTLVILLMTVAMLAFATAAESRARVLSLLAEEVGASRFVEEKAAHPRTEVLRLRQLQASRQPEELPLRDAGLAAPKRLPATDTPGWAPEGPRGPPHLPRAPPVAD